MAIKQKTTRIFLIRGLAREVRHWGDFLPIMAESFSDAKIHPLEIPGTGRLRHHISPVKIDDYIHIMRQQYLSHTVEDDYCTILGFSLGGMITARWLQQNPHDFSAAVLINTSLPPSPVLRRLRISGGVHLLLSILNTDLYKREKRLAKLLCNLADHEKIAHRWTEISRTAPVSLMNFLRQLYTAVTFTLPAKPKVPTLILSSKNDRLVSAKSSEDIASLWNTTLFCHDTAGHDITTDDPHWCIQRLQAWPHFSRHPGGS